MTRVRNAAEGLRSLRPFALGGKSTVVSPGDHSPRRTRDGRRRPTNLDRRTPKTEPNVNTNREPRSQQCELRQLFHALRPGSGSHVVHGRCVPAPSTEPTPASPPRQPIYMAHMI